MDIETARSELSRLRGSQERAASLWMVEFRGESTATMVYDGQHYYFLLERE